jgi:predicted unusual protein kinase regulating ubiquinone biosynthesis (AarF/ABC1/UbiB family)
VLVADRAPGESLWRSPFLQQDRRDVLSRSVLEFALSGMQQGLFNADPSPGNLRVAGDEAWFIDFGSYKTWSAQQASGWTALIRAILAEDRELYRSAIDLVGFSALGNYDHESSYDIVVPATLALWCNEAAPLNRRHLSQHFEMMFGPEAVRTRKRNRSLEMYVPKDLLLGFRTYFGTLYLIADLGGRVNLRTAMSQLVSP